MNVELDLARPLKRLFGNVLGAPGDVLEKAAVRGLDPEKIIAAVGRGTEHGALTWLRQRIRSLHKECRWQGRAVGVEHDRRTVAAREHFLDRAQQTIAEIRQTGVDQADRGR